MSEIQNLKQKVDIIEKENSDIRKILAEQKLELEESKLIKDIKILKEEIEYLKHNVEELMNKKMNIENTEKQATCKSITENVLKNFDESHKIFFPEQEADKENESFMNDTYLKKRKYHVKM